MKKNILQKFLSLLFLINLVLGCVGSVSAAGNLQDAFSQGGLLDSVGEGAGYDTDQRSIDPIIANVISVALSLLGAIFIVLMIYGGYTWMTAAGNDQQVAKARNLVIAAIIGLLVVVAAYAFTYFIFSRLANPLIE